MPPMLPLGEGTAAVAAAASVANHVEFWIVNPTCDPLCRVILIGGGGGGACVDGTCDCACL